MDMNMSKTDNNIVICDKNEYEYLTRCKILVDSIISKMYKSCTNEYVDLAINHYIFEALFPDESQKVKEYYKNEYGKEVKII